ncbi:hypothetical protein [Solidesulfovibrio carbinolicus]|jgi:hypothetical protein|uniref:Uncharacterized protein n=1 Tax=Solidesulfovibrio carbinolicus TaxID=296842 RepID=A0A4P6HHK8_9BACT|nr:hypothetical protein [Solidesulfovibrio carbinolicus]QAZ66255.1 hypothetical protein C3Y92_02960 [Solidesulfovibrio carbinolicus]HML56534.1 hypothetical protein [Solidesulfovibrio magneticus]
MSEEVVPQDIEAQVAAIEAEMAELLERKAAAEKRARDFMAAEDHKAGVSHAQEIFAAKQEKLMLDTEWEIARRKKNRLLMPQ